MISLWFINHDLVVSFRHCIAGRVFKRDQGERSVWRLSWRCRIAWVRWVWRWDDLNGQVRTYALRLQNCWQLWADEQAILHQKCWSLVHVCKILKSITKSSVFSYTVKGWKGGGFIQDWMIRFGRWDMSQKHQVRSSLLDAIQAPDPERGKSLYVEEAGDEASGSLAWFRCLLSTCSSTGWLDSDFTFGTGAAPGPSAQPPDSADSGFRHPGPGLKHTFRCDWT